MNLLKLGISLFAAALMAAPSLVAAQPAANDGEKTLPKPTSDHDPRPPVAYPGTPPGGLIAQAGVGGEIAYGRSGVLELGGSAGLTAASGFMAVSVSPSIGWFFADNMQLSAILGITHVETDTGATTEKGTLYSFLIENSYHLPFGRSVFGFAGLGIGAAHADEVGWGVAIAPRLGLNVMVGRSGILTPALSYQYNTHEAMELEQFRGYVGVTTALAANIGYTVMW